MKMSDLKKCCMTQLQKRQGLSRGGEMRFNGGAGLCPWRFLDSRFIKEHLTERRRWRGWRAFRRPSAGSAVANGQSRCQGSAHPSGCTARMPMRAPRLRSLLPAPGASQWLGRYPTEWKSADAYPRSSS